jgi:signal transduction histidine kinase
MNRLHFRLGAAYAAAVDEAEHADPSPVSRVPEAAHLRADLTTAATMAAVACSGVWVEISYATRPLPPMGWAYVFTIAAAAPLALLRRRRPVIAALCCLLGCLGYHVAGYPGFAPALLLFVAAHALAAYGPRTRGLVHGLLLGAAAWAVPALPPHALPWYDFAVSMPALSMAGTAFVGASARRARLAHHQQIQQSAATAEARLELRLAEERLRIAQELHDVLAHTISVVVVQSGVALDALGDSPAASREAILAVRRAAKQAVPELRAALEALRGHRPRQDADTGPERAEADQQHACR